MLSYALSSVLSRKAAISSTYLFYTLVFLILATLACCFQDYKEREKMGRIVNNYANRIYVTDDNPRFEDSSKIRQSILKYCKNHAIEIPERKKAIENAINDLKKNEILIIAGKGHENFQIIRDISNPLDDYKLATNALRKKL